MVARAIVATKIRSHISVSAVRREALIPFLQGVSAARSVRDVMVQEAQAARVVWPTIPVITWRSGSPRIPASWKLPYSMRRRTEGPSSRDAIHPVNALLNVAFSVTAGRLAVQLAALGACPAIGLLHSDKPRRWSLAYDGIEPLRPPIERRVFDFIRKHQFGPNDFIQTNDGTIRINDNLLRVVIAETALGGRTTDAAVNWIVGLLRCEPNLSNPISLPPAFLPGL